LHAEENCRKLFHLFQTSNFQCRLLCLFNFFCFFGFTLFLVRRMARALGAMNQFHYLEEVEHQWPRISGRMRCLFHCFGLCIYTDFPARWKSKKMATSLMKKGAFFALDHLAFRKSGKRTRSEKQCSVLPSALSFLSSTPRLL